MKIGIGAATYSFGVSPIELAKLGEDLGYESMWVGEHPIIPLEIKNNALYGTELPDSYKYMPDPTIWFTAASAVTTKLKFGFCIILIPQHSPFTLAKRLSSMDQITNGRVILGAGAGWIEEEAQIFGYPFDKRWPITMDYLAAMKTLWTQDVASYNGEYISFPEVYSYPKPVQKPHPPVLIGAGNPDTKAMGAILRRTVQHADGWVPALFTPEQIAPHMQRLRDLCDEHGRDFSQLDTTLLVPAVNLSAGDRCEFMGDREADPRNPQELIAQYEELGVTRIIVGFDELTREKGLQIVENAAKVLKLY